MSISRHFWEESNSSSSGSDKDSDSSSDSEFVTLGYLSAFKPIDWKFPDSNKCPLDKCGLSFASRYVAIAHFRNEHATTTALCSICNRLFSDIKPSRLLTHYSIQHPNDTPPELKLAKPIATKKENEMQNADDDEKDDDNNDSDEDEDGSEWENDLITLNGCGIETHWRFPNITYCPVQNCRKTFGVRSDAIWHYKKFHSNHAIYCSLCEKPISSRHSNDFKKHFKSLHPNEKMPFNFDEEKQSTSVSPKSTEGMEITLNGCGRSVKWRVPRNMKLCPNTRCNARFEDYSHLVNHFTKMHASYYTYCNLCEKPFSARYPNDIVMHYRCKHPKAQIPSDFNKKTPSTTKPAKSKPKSEVDDFDDGPIINDDIDDWITLRDEFGREVLWEFPQNTPNCPSRSCGLAFKSRGLAIAHYKERHTNDYILCSRCNRLIFVERLSQITSHYKLYHRDREPPTYFEKKDQQTDKYRIVQVSSSDEENGENSENHDDNDDDEEKIESKDSTSVENEEEHSASNNDLDKILCPLKECTYASEQLECVHQHWENKHGHLRFPEFRKEAKYPYKTTDTSHQSETLDTTSDESSLGVSLLVPMSSTASENSNKRKFPRPNISGSLAEVMKKSKMTANKQHSGNDHRVKDLYFVRASENSLLSCTIVRDRKKEVQNEIKTPVFETMKIQNSFTINHVQGGKEVEDADTEIDKDFNESVDEEKGDEIGMELGANKNNNTKVYQEKIHYKDIVEDFEEKDNFKPVDLTLPIYVPDSDEENFNIDIVANNAMSSIMTVRHASQDSFHTREMQVLMMANKS